MDHIEHTCIWHGKAEGFNTKEVAMLYKGREQPGLCMQSDSGRKVKILVGDSIGSF
jgi:hypothetical protein